jgi:very-short-patch-repair endonuclease
MQRKQPLARKPDLEHRLWLGLRALKQQGWHFRKASPFRSFLLPFVEHQALLVVEISERGNIVRDRLLREAGYTILRFSPGDARQSLDLVLRTVRAVLKDRSDAVA